MLANLGRALAVGAILVGAAACAPFPRAHGGDMRMQHEHMAGMSPAADPRPVVKFPEAMRIHTLANMRDHLLALQQIEEALSKEQYDRASDLAERRLGMSSLALHGAHDLAPFMPQGMQNIGTEMHRAASRFALAAKDAGATGDVKPALAALADVSRQCVACHSSYRVQ